MTDKNTDGKYPYTYACDYLRSASPWGKNGCVLSRSDTSQILKLIATAMCKNDEEIAKRLADTFLKYEPMIHIFVDDEPFIVPDNSIGFKIVHISGMKQAMWLQPKKA